MTLSPRNAYVEPETDYDEQFELFDDYIQSLPDLQHGAIKGSQVYIPHVGIHRFRIPLKIARRYGGHASVEASVTGTVSLDAENKGINMSRIIRTFYEHVEESQDAVFTLGTLNEILRDIKRKSGSFDAELKIKFSYPIRQDALRSSDLSGFQFYDVIFGIIVEGYQDNFITNTIDFDFVYSSACPCSYELAEHARQYRNRATVSHSQRSVARVQLLLDNDIPHIWIEEIQELCLSALHTETQVMVKRPDEQAFAELNGSYTKFVEDAARQLHQVFDAREDILDFRIVCSHLESLHSHDAIAILTKNGKDDIGSYYRPTLDFHELQSLLR